MRQVVRGAILVLAISALSPSHAAAGLICDLSTVTGCGPISGDPGSGLFFRNDQQPTGTGYIDSFLRVQQNGWEQGYNTSDRSYPTPTKMQPTIQDKTDPNFTRDLSLANVGHETLNGTDYLVFFLDVNEPASSGKSLITLDQLEIFTSAVALAHPTYTPGNVNQGGSSANGTLAGTNGSTTKIYDMDIGKGGSAVDNWVNIDYNVSSGGSGKADMVFYLPSSLVPVGSQYVYLYSEFGNYNNMYPGKYASQAGFEEWWTNSPTYVTPFANVPEPGSIALLGFGLLALAHHWQRKRRHAPLP